MHMRVSDPVIDNVIGEMLLNSPDSAVRRAAVQFLRSRRSASNQELLRRALGDADPLVRGEAYIALLELGTAGEIGESVKRYERIETSAFGRWCVRSRRLFDRPHSSSGRQRADSLDGRR